jgi:hypothetical protein
MTSPTAEPDKRMREDRRKPIESRKRKQKLVMPICIIILTVTYGFQFQDLLNRHRVEDAATQVLESRGGDVVRVVHPGGRRGPGGYVDVVFGGKPGVKFDGQLNRCDLDALNESPPVFTAMVTSQQPDWKLGDEPALGCEPGER